MLTKYRNVFCDTAFVPFHDVQNIVSAGFAERIFTGSDFPITHYFTTKYPEEAGDSSIALQEQYVKDLQKMKEVAQLK
jgi:hypothetical protein